MQSQKNFIAWFNICKQRRIQFNAKTPGGTRLRPLFREGTCWIS
ncbi:hypothetical protein DESPIG_00054 [Desulfovibrio piger ATCC 29098]|uniref:Uncharacterized protein n=1 Tax=Desulfovibrio piger ATCC 29098 TaxID=411464 RepID=B6WPT9_9BACT|nr:hypothetical protein DESPIG_00054 [Desulfovibrio piger ATCC 29098]